MQTAITTLETSMMSWVNKTLAEGYYDIADIDALLAALETKVADGNAALTKAIKDQQDALNKAKDELTTAYKKAITSAIEANNGVIDTKIASAVKAAQDALQSQITAITAEIAAIKADIELIKSRIATIEEQIAGINTSLADLQAMDTKLDGYITTLQTTADNLQAQITEANTQIEKVKQEMGAEIDAVEQNLLNQLNEIKTSLESQLATVKADINTLKAKDTELEGKITALQTYVDNQLAANKDWANATFATLAQYEEVQTTISGINATIAGINTSMTDLETRINAKIAADIQAAINALPDNAANIATAVTEVTGAYTAAIATAKGEIETAYTAAIATAISNLETSMKEWVNTTIAESYYKKSEIDAKLEALKTDAGKYTDEAELQAAIAAQQAKLEKAVENLTTAYTAAITEAINNNNGAIDTKIANAIATANAELQSQITIINTAIDDIHNRLNKLEARIQSIRFLPEYSDGKVELTSENAPVTLTFLLSPSEAAQAVATAYQSNNSVVTAYLSRTQSRTRAVDAPTAITVTNVVGTAQGMLTVTVNTKNLPADYWSNAETANLYIQINDGNNDVISEMIPTFYTELCMLPDGRTFNSVVKDQLTDNIKTIKFIAGSTEVTNLKIGSSTAYMKVNSETLEIHTVAKKFVFNTNCEQMFRNFEKITTIDFNNCINTANVTDMSGMFDGCQALTSLDLSAFNTTNVKNMSYMFAYCQALTSLDLSGFNTTNVENMSGMFNWCKALNSLDVSSFNTENVTNMTYMFNLCIALTSLDLSSFNTAKVTDMSFMFNRCIALTSLDLSGFNTENVTKMNYMFDNCIALTSLDLSGFKTTNVEDMSYMFHYCQNLSMLDIHNFNIENISNRRNIDAIFSNVGESYYTNNNNNKAKIKVTTALKAALDDEGVSTGDYAEYEIVSDAGLNNFGWGGSLTGN